MDRLRQQTEKFLDTEVIKTETWAETLYDSLRALGITIFCYVPDAGHRVLIERSIVDDNVVSIPLTTEEEGVALLAGAHLGGKRGVLLMQSSGVGNCINMMSLINAGRFPFLTIVSMRGDFGEQNPWQLPMGQAVEPCLTPWILCVSASRLGKTFLRPPRLQRKWPTSRTNPLLSCFRKN